MSHVNNDKPFPSRQRRPRISQLQGLGLGLGLGLSDCFALAAFKEDEEEAITEQEQEGLTREELEHYAHNIEAAEQARASITEAEIEAKGIEPDMDLLTGDGEPPIQISSTKAIDLPKSTVTTTAKTQKLRDFFSSLSNTPELFMELAKHLRIKDLISIYAISRDFHETMNGHLTHCMKRCSSYMAPESSRLFLFKFYGPLCVDDPMGRSHPQRQGQVKKAPGLRWLQMVVHREKAVRDILACMARQGHRMPKGVSFSLKKMWLMMDISTSRGRIQMVHNNKIFTDIDLYNIQLFIHKLDMRFNDPIDGPGTEDLRILFLGQRGLTPLCNLLKRKAYLDLMSVVKLALRYSYVVRPENRGVPIFGIPPEQIGTAHLEGWGVGRAHLLRPDELVMRESVRRQLGFKEYIMHMMLWGYVNPVTGKNIEVSEEEMYMSDEEGLKKRERPERWNDYWDVAGAVKGREKEGEEDEDEISDESDEDNSGEDGEEDSQDDDDDEMDHEADLDSYYFGSGTT